MYASDSPKEIHKFAKDAIEVGSFKIARIFTKRIRVLMHEAKRDNEIEEIAEILTDIRSRME